MGAPSLQQDQQSPSAADENEIDDKVETAKQAASSASAGGVAETLSGNHGQGDIGDGLVESYTSLIQQYLSVMCLDNAIFLAERLVATEKSSYSLYLLALCHHRSGQPRSALSVLEQTTTTSSSIYYLTAVCCYELEEYGRAEEALLHQCRLDFRQQRSNTISVTEPLSKASERMEQWIVTTTPCPVPNGAAGLYLLGNICRKSNRKARAIQYYRMSLQLDPFLFTSYESLCELGGADDLDPTSVFGVHPKLVEATETSDDDVFLPLQDRNTLTPSFRLIETPASENGARQNSMQQSMGMATPASAAMPKASLFSSASGFHKNNHPSNMSARMTRFETPDLTPIPANASLLAQSPAGDMEGCRHHHRQNPRVVRRAQQVAARLYYEPSPETPHTAEIRTSLQYLRGLGRQAGPAINNSAVGETPLRRGGGHDSAPVPYARQPRTLFFSSENNINNTADAPEGIDDSQDSALPQPEKGLAGDLVKSDGEQRQQGIQDILGLLCLLGSAWRRVCQYRCQEALHIFSRLPENHRSTGWVLNQQGRAYFEMNDFQNAKRCLELMQTVEPHRMKGLDLLSTVYWQLKQEVELAHLAQWTVDFNKFCPQAWCVVGNCFSLQKEHETALSYFKRSLQLDPSFTYTHTLSGYEYMANEDFDKAVACFRNAIRSDERHYNAWYGLGAIYHRQEKYDLAEYHFQRAVSINPQSSVLRCNLGIAQFSNGNAYQALDTLAEAFRLDPRNPQARFQRATIYSAMNRPAEALAELEKVRDAAPREATVHFAIGRMLKRLGRLEEAMKCFLTAMDLDPKDSQLIKSAMDKLEEPDIDEEDYSSKF